jgi:hypothetical protein
LQQRADNIALVEAKIGVAVGVVENVVSALHREILTQSLLNSVEML